MDGAREVNVFMAKVAQECQKSEECIAFMREVISQGRPLSYNERNLIGGAYKSLVAPLRDSLRLLMEENHEFDVSAAVTEISQLLTGKCDEVLNVIRSTLLPAVTEPEVRIFYIKMIADYMRYKWEGTPEGNRSAVSQQCRDSYQEAVDLANISLPSYHPLKLGLCLNFAVFLYEVFGGTKEAFDLASKTYLEAGTGIDQLSPESQDDAKHTIALLHENIELWRS
jgi:14-3-3 protein epsilon